MQHHERDPRPEGIPDTTERAGHDMSQMEHTHLKQETTSRNMWRLQADAYGRGTSRRYRGTRPPRSNLVSPRVGPGGAAP